jgi:steroid Delta-isomerase
MHGPAAATISQFGNVEDDQKYTRLVDLFTADATYYDPFFGPQVGKEAIRAFMAHMEVLVPKSGARFEEWESAGDTVCGWSRWLMTAPGEDGERMAVPGQSLYRLTPEGKVCFVADYVDSKAYARLRPGGPVPNAAGAAGLSAKYAPAGSYPALDLVKRFWQIQDDGDYERLAPLFTDDAVFLDLIYGRFEGGRAIADYMTQMKSEMPQQGITFHLVDCAGDTNVAWSQWIAKSNQQEMHGWTLHTARGDKFTLDADYFDRSKRFGRT